MSGLEQRKEGWAGRPTISTEWVCHRQEFCSGGGEGGNCARQTKILPQTAEEAAHADGARNAAAGCSPPQRKAQISPPESAQRPRGVFGEEQAEGSFWISGGASLAGTLREELQLPRGRAALPSPKAGPETLAFCSSSRVAHKYTPHPQWLGPALGNLQS